MRTALAIAFLLSRPSFAGDCKPLNPNRQAIANFLIGYIGATDGEAPDYRARIESHSGVLRTDNSVKEVKKVIELLESRMGHEATVEQFRSRFCSYGLRFDTLRAVIAVTDFFLGNSGTNARLFENFSAFTGPYGDVWSVIHARFDYQLIPSALRASHYPYHDFMDDMLAEVRKIDGIPSKALTRKVLARHIDDFAALEKSGFADWGKSRDRRCNGKFLSQKYRPTQPVADEG